MSRDLEIKMEQIANGKPFDAEQINDELYNELVKSIGAADTYAGEILRAVNRIIYRFNNDGDQAGIGYGRETVNPAVRYLNYKLGRKSPDIEMLYDSIYEPLASSTYERILKNILYTCIRLIAIGKLWNKSNNEDYNDYANDNYDYDDSKEYDDYEDEEDNIYENLHSKNMNKIIIDANNPKSFRHLNEAYLEQSDFAEAAKWLVKYLQDNGEKICSYYQQHGSDTGHIGYDALERVINSTCLWVNKEYVK